MKNIVLGLLLFVSTVASASHGEVKYDNSNNGGGGGGGAPQHSGNGGPSGGAGGGGSLGSGGTVGNGNVNPQWAAEQREKLLREENQNTYDELYRSKDDWQKHVLDEQKQIVSTIDQTLSQLSNNSAFFTREGFNFTQEQLQDSEGLIWGTPHVNTHIPRNGKLIYDYAVDRARIIGDFVNGVANGTIRGFENQLITAQQVAKAIWEDPTLLNNMVQNFSTSIMQSPEALRDTLIGMYKDFVLMTEYGTAYDAGFATGNFIANTVSTLAAGEASAPIANAMGSIQKALLSSSQRGWFSNTLTHRLKQVTGVDAWKHWEGIDVKQRGAMRGWNSAFKATHFETAESANARHIARELANGAPKPPEPPFWPGTRVTNFITKDVVHFVRVHGPNNQVGQWLLRADGIKGLTAEEIQVKYAMPYKPTYLSDVHVPAGTKMTRGTVNDVLYDITDKKVKKNTPFGTVQYKLEEFIPKDSFVKKRSIP